MNTWRYDIRTWYPEEATTFIGNGLIGGNLPIDGHGGGGNPYMAKLAAHYVGQDEAFVGVPHWLDVSLRIDGRHVEPQWVGFRQSLDLRTGTFSTSYVDRLEQVRVSTETFCQRACGGAAAYTMTIEALRDIEIDVDARLSLARCDGPHGATPSSDLSASTVGWEIDWDDDTARVAQILQLDGMPNAAAHRSEQAIGLAGKLSLKAGRQHALRGSVVLARGAAPAAAAKKLIEQWPAAAYKQSSAANAAAMERLWSDYSIRVENPYAERRANASMFYLLCGYRDDVVWGGTATGLSSKGSWGGSVLWDTEFYMFPAMLPFFPGLVKNMLAYRYQTLAGAQAGARRHGERGARYAWQSKRSGLPFGGAFEDERHISSDVAFACDWYRRTAADKEFDAAHGSPIIAEVARNWASRVIESRPGRFEIHGVIPPDEHVWDHYRGKPVNNSTMTNAYARWTLETAAADTGNGADAAERAHWTQIAAGLCMPRDTVNNIFAEYDGYDGHPIKQADIGHLFFPLCVSRDPDEIRRNVNYYADREQETGLFLTHSPFVYGAAMSRAGDVDGVSRFLEMSDRNCAGPFEIPRESNYCTGPVTTGAGSYINLLLYAALGIENTGDVLSAHPCVPASLGSVEARRVLFDGKRHAVRARHGSSDAVIEIEQ